MMSIALRSACLAAVLGLVTGSEVTQADPVAETRGSRGSSRG